MREIKNRFPSRSAGLGGCGGSCSTQTSAAQARHDNKCGEQRIPLYADVPAPTVDVGGAVTAPAIITIEPDHDGDLFDPETMFLTAEYVNEDGNLTDADDIYVRYIKIGKDSYDCLSQTEPRGVQVLAYSQPHCCDGIPLCAPAFGNKKNDKDVLTIEIVNRQTETLDAGTIVGRAVRLRGFIKGSCSSCGYEKRCPEPPAAATA